MNSRSSLIALSIAMAVLSLALFIAVVGGMASSMSGAAIDIEQETGKREVAEDRPFAYQGASFSQRELLTLTEPISIYLPLVSTAGYIDKAVERAALMALFSSTNGDVWINNTGWGTEASFCEWYGVTCDENGHVTVLDMEQNMISGTLPSEIGTLQKLTKLRLTGTSITMWCNTTKSAPPPCYYNEYYQLSGPIPSEIGNLQNLQELNLHYNKLASLPPEIENLVNLQYLDLSINQLTSLPPEIGNLIGLQGIGLWGNGLDTLPAEIGNLVNLPELNLMANKLTSLPPEIGNLVNLQELNLMNNNLTSLPPEIGNLASVYYLDIEYNQLISLPAEIGNLVSLQALYLLGNQLSILPPEIGNLENLGTLYMGDNQLTSLPPEIGNLASLHILDLHDNQISGIIPAFLSNLGNLGALSLEGNPDLTCWETEEARDWALSLSSYYGPSCFIP